jgi:hypothetical protein
VSLVSPCLYPGCDDGHDQPELTSDCVCSACRRRYRRLLDWIVEDYATVKTALPAPTRTSSNSKLATTRARSFGHPAEWASDTASWIADILGWVEDGLRDELGDEPPLHPRAVEAHRVAAAYHYLTVRMNALCTYSAARDTAIELVDLHAQVRRTLGLTRFTQRLPTPCPNCDVAGLLRTTGRIECANCATVIREEHYPFLTRLVIDELITAYDTRKITLELPVGV